MKSTLAESIRREFRFPKEHPCFEGHFPSEPIVPGVMILNKLRVVLREWKPETRIKALSNVKFHLPLYPEETFTLSLSEAIPCFIHFEFLRGNQKLVSGSLSLERMA